MDRPEILRSSGILKSFLAAVVGVLVLFAACGRDKQSAQPLPPNQGRRISVPFDALRAQFRNPDMIYAPFVFWFWDEPLDPAKMREMSRVMVGQRFNPGYAHARKSMVGTPDLPDAEWLGDKWFEAFGAALGEAEAGKGYLGYCDEYWWPSFQANGRILKENPELKAQSLRWEAIDVKGGSEVRVPASFFAVAAEREQPLSVAADRMPSPKMGKWIWHTGGTDAAHSCWFRKTFDLPLGSRADRAAVNVIVDNAYVLYLNGKKVGEGDNWEKTGIYDVTTLVIPGRNTLAVEGKNVSGPFGLLFGMAITLAGGRTIDVGSDKTWLASLEPAAGWERPDFAASGSWTASREIAEAGGGSWRYVQDRIDHVPALIRSRTLRTIGAGAPFVWKAPAQGAWRVYAFNLYSHAGADGSTVNYLDSRLAPAFISTALEPYARRLGDKLGKSIPGDFIDNEGDYGWGLAWSDTLDTRCKERFGRDIRLWLPLSVDRDVEGVFARARWEWFDLVTDIYAETFRAVTDWHEKRGMSTTAHFWEEGIQPQVNAVGDHLKMLRTLTMAGQDCLGRKPLRVHDFKEVESVAEFEGSRAATELMGAGAFDGTPWNTFNPVFLKQAANAVTAWGMSQIIPHGVFTTRKLTGNPWPPDWYSENPMFPYLHLWTDFARRASFVNSMGHAAPDVLLWNPIESAWVQADADILDAEMWTFSDTHPGGKRINEIDRVYAAAIDDLTAARVEFLIGDRYYLKQMEVRDGKLVRGEFSFRTLVLPAVDILPLEAARKIVAFAASGGRVFALAALPGASAEKGIADPEMARLMDELRAQPIFMAVDEAGLPALAAQAAPGLASPVRFASGAFPMLQHRRRIDGRDFFWLANNTDMRQVCELEVTGVHGAASIWDCETGEVRPVASVETKEASRLTRVFKPYEAGWLVFDPNEKANAGPAERTVEVEVVAAIEGTWKVSYDPKVQPTMEYPSVPSAEFSSGVEKPLEDWKAWGLTKFSGLLDYAKTVTVDGPAKDMKLDLGKVCHVAEIWVNGKSCGARLWGPHVFDVGEALRPGANEIRVRVANLINNSYGEITESGLLGPVRLVR
ncbi:MAG: glycosyl hydrolase [Candidatus Aminicenantes bacterium]|nr:glycosyl hydrolase [Candidatus Aminicenantes bacterium]